MVTSVTPAFRERLLESREGDVLVVRVVVGFIVAQTAVVFMGFLNIANIVHLGPFSKLVRSFFLLKKV